MDLEGERNEGVKDVSQASSIVHFPDGGVIFVSIITHDLENS